MTGVAKLCFASHTTTPRRIAPRTRTAFSRARADQGGLIGRNTEGIEYGVSVSGKLA